MINKGEKRERGNRVFNLCNLKMLIKIVVLVLVATFLYKAFIEIPAKEMNDRYYIEVTTQNEEGEAQEVTMKITEAKSLCHFDAINVAQKNAESGELPEDFNINALYENQYVLCLRAIGI